MILNDLINSLEGIFKEADNNKREVYKKYLKNVIKTTNFSLILDYSFEILKNYYTEQRELSLYGFINEALGVLNFSYANNELLYKKFSNLIFSIKLKNSNNYIILLNKLYIQLFKYELITVGNYFSFELDLIEYNDNLEFINLIHKIYIQRYKLLINEVRKIADKGNKYEVRKVIFNKDNKQIKKIYDNKDLISNNPKFSTDLIKLFSKFIILTLSNNLNDYLFKPYFYNFVNLFKHNNVSLYNNIYNILLKKIKKIYTYGLLQKNEVYELIKTWFQIINNEVDCFLVLNMSRELLFTIINLFTYIFEDIWLHYGSNLKFEGRTELMNNIKDLLLGNENILFILTNNLLKSSIKYEQSEIEKLELNPLDYYNEEDTLNYDNSLRFTSLKLIKTLIEFYIENNEKLVEFFVTQFIKKFIEDYNYYKNNKTNGINLESLWVAFEHLNNFIRKYEDLTAYYNIYLDINDNFDCYINVAILKFINTLLEEIEIFDKQYLANLLKFSTILLNHNNTLYNVFGLKFINLISLKIVRLKDYNFNMNENLPLILNLFDKLNNSNSEYLNKYFQDLKYFFDVNIIEDNINLLIDYYIDKQIKFKTFFPNFLEIMQKILNNLSISNIVNNLVYIEKCIIIIDNFYLNINEIDSLISIESLWIFKLTLLIKIEKCLNYHFTNTNNYLSWENYYKLVLNFINSIILEKIMNLTIYQKDLKLIIYYILLYTGWIIQKTDLILYPQSYKVLSFNYSNFEYLDIVYENINYNYLNLSNDNSYVILNLLSYNDVQIKKNFWKSIEDYFSSISIFNNDDDWDNFLNIFEFTYNLFPSKRNEIEKFIYIKINNYLVNDTYKDLDKEKVFMKFIKILTKFFLFNNCNFNIEDNNILRFLIENINKIKNFENGSTKEILLLGILYNEILSYYIHKKQNCFIELFSNLTLNENNNLNKNNSLTYNINYLNEKISRIIKFVQDYNSDFKDHIVSDLEYIKITEPRFIEVYKNDYNTDEEEVIPIFKTCNLYSLVINVNLMDNYHKNLCSMKQNNY